MRMNRRRSSAIPPEKTFSVRGLAGLTGDGEWTLRQEVHAGRLDKLVETIPHHRAQARIVVVLMPALDPEAPLNRFGSATVEALLAACRTDARQPLNDDTYLELIADTDWRPEVRYLQPADE